MLPDGNYVKAEYLQPYSRLMLKYILMNNRPCIDIQDLVYKKYYGDLPEGCVEHHTEENYEAKETVYNHISYMIDSKLPYNVNEYYNSLSQKSSITEDKIQYFMELYKYEYPFIVDISIEDVNQVPMYDFTVDNYENMIIPVGNTLPDMAVTIVVCALVNVCAKKIKKM